MRDNSDMRTPDLFRHDPQVRLGRDIRAEFSNQVAGMLATCNRYQIAARMTDFVGRPISKNMLDAWASPAREGHNIPAYAAPLLEMALDCRDLTGLALSLHGGQALYGEAVMQAVIDRELVALEVNRERVGRQIRNLRKKREVLG